MLHPFIKTINITNRYLIDLKTYFKAHGFDYTSQKKMTSPLAKADQLFKSSVSGGSAGAVAEIRQAKQENYTGSDKSYLTGGWFEEWLFAFLKRELNLNDDAIAFNLKLKNRKSLRQSDADNEVDVAFVYNNRLYIWECKVFNSSYVAGKRIAETVYKISSLSQSLGLQAVSFVIIFTPFGEDVQRREFLNDITRLMRIKKVFSLEDLTDTNSFINSIKKIIGYGS